MEVVSLLMVRGWDNVCEHGDHSAPDGRRYCSTACEKCDATDPQPDGECANVCGMASPAEALDATLAAYNATAPDACGVMGERP